MQWTDAKIHTLEKANEKPKQKLQKSISVYTIKFETPPFNVRFEYNYKRQDSDFNFNDLKIL
jgi:hypothetical protein